MSEQIRVANMLKCRVGKLAMNYLGLPISCRAVGATSFEGMVNKMRNRLQ